MNDRDIERLLGAHFAGEVERRCLDDGTLVAYVAGERSAEVVAKVHAHLPTCATCREALASIEADRDTPTAVVDADWSTPAWLAPVRGGGSAAQRAARAPRARWPWALAAAALIGAGVGVALTREPDPGSRIRGGGADTSESAPADRFVVLASRAGSYAELAPHAKLTAGDELVFAYSTTRAGHLVIADLEPGRAPTLLHPLGDADSAIRPGTEIAVSAGKVTAGVACEWLVAVFSDEPLKTDVVTSALLAPRVADSSACELDVTVAGARSVVVFPFRR